MAKLKSASAQGEHTYGSPINASTPIKVNNASLPNLQPLIQAGIDPKTKLPIKVVANTNQGFKPHNKKLLRIIDEQDAVYRYTWYNLPNGLNQELIERILYYRGQGMFFYMETDNKFYFLPYALDGTIDVYGRFVDVTPLPFNGTATADGKEKPWITGLRKHVVYDLKLDELTIDDLTESCVLLSDYIPQQSQTNISRQVLNDPLLDVMADCIPFLRTALLNATGVEGMRVNSEDDYSNVDAASTSIDRAALTGRKFIPIIGQIDFQEMTGGNVAKSEEFLLAMQGLDNYRLSTYGLKNGGLFQKKAHMLQSEQDQAGISNSPLEDGKLRRQHFCNLVNSIWGIGIWCEISEAQMSVDQNGDGIASDDETDEAIQTQQAQSGGENESMD